MIRDPNLDEEIIAYDKLQTDDINDLEVRIGNETNNLKPSVVPVNIIVGGLSTQTISPTTYGVRVNVKLGNNDYHSSAYMPRELFQRWNLLKDSSNNSVLFRVTSTSKIELWSGSPEGSAITGFYEYK